MNKITKIAKDHDKIPDIKCCNRLMRNIYEHEYRNESTMNDRGDRDKNGDTDGR